MSDPVHLDFSAGSDAGRGGITTGAMHWNCFAEPSPVDAKKMPSILRACDGLTSFTSLSSTGNIRGALTMGSYLYVVSGTQLFRVDDQGEVLICGGIPGTERVIMTRNDATIPQLVIITGEGERYVCASDTVASISDADLPVPVSATYLNQRVIYGIADGRVFFSAVDNATDIDALDVFTAEAAPDGLVSVVAHMQEVWCFGRESIEVWSNTTDEVTPFVRNNSASGVIPRGALNKHTIKAIDVNLFWVGDDRNVYKSQGYGGEQIANVGILELLRTSDGDSLGATTYTAWGHAFYVLSGTTTAGVKWSWAYNRSTGQWDPRSSYGDTRWRIAEVVNFAGMLIAGAYDDGSTLYKIDRDAHDEGGVTMIWRARSAPMHSYPNQLAIDRLHLDLVTGVGLNSSDAHASSPKVGLRWSDDGGATWSNQELRDLGQLGARMTRVSFEQLGCTPPTGRIWEVEMSSPVVRAMMLASVEGDVLLT